MSEAEASSDRLPAVMIDEDHYAVPAHGWTCFHCGETFLSPGAARDHFGADQLQDPACRIKAGEEQGLVRALRRAESELARYRCEDSDADRAMAAMRSDHAQALIVEEEKGYARGLRDARREFEQGRDPAEPRWEIGAGEAEKSADIFELAAKTITYLAELADFNLSWTDGRRGPPEMAGPIYIERCLEVARERTAQASAIRMICEEARTAAADRDALLAAIGARCGPLGDGGRRKMLLEEAAALRPAMVAARRDLEKWRSDAELWQLLEAEGHVSGLLAKVWRQRKEAEKALRKAHAANERDRCTVAEAVTRWKETLANYAWLKGPGRGSYAYDDDRYRLEFGAALDQLEAVTEPLRKIASDHSDCPPTLEEKLKARLEA